MFWRKCEMKKYRNKKAHDYDPNIQDKGYLKDSNGATVYYSPISITSEQKFKLLEKECTELIKLIQYIKKCMESDINKHL